MPAWAVGWGGHWGPIHNVGYSHCWCLYTRTRCNLPLLKTPQTLMLGHREVNLALRWKLLPIVYYLCFLRVFCNVWEDYCQFWPLPRSYSAVETVCEHKQHAKQIVHRWNGGALTAASRCLFMPHLWSQGILLVGLLAIKYGDLTSRWPIHLPRMGPKHKHLTLLIVSALGFYWWIFTSQVLLLVNLVMHSRYLPAVAMSARNLVF